MVDVERSLLLQLSELSIASGTVVGMPTYDLHSCLSVIEKLIRQLEGRRNEVVTAIGVNSRATIARITKSTGRSVRNARQQTKTAKVAAKTPGGAEAMNRGDVCGDHVLALAGVDERLLALMTRKRPKHCWDGQQVKRLTSSQKPSRNICLHPIRSG